MKKKLFIFVILVGLITIIVSFKLFNMGFRLSVLAALISLSGLSAKVNNWVRPSYTNGWAFETYKDIKGKNNPLFQKGCFRKKDPVIFSKLKGRYRCQVYAVVQCCIFLSYGVFTVVFDMRSCLFETIMVILMPIPPLMQDAVQAGYDRIIKRESERTNKQKVWEVFSLEGKDLEIDEIQTKNIELQEIKKLLSDLCNKNEFIFWEKYEKGQTEARLFFREQENWLDIFLIVKSKEKNITEFCEEMKPVVQDFLKEYYGSKLKYPLLNLEVLIYTNEIETFHTLLEHAQMCTPGTALALTVFYMKEETFYISGWKKYIEKTGDRSILQKFFQGLEINNK